MKYGLALPYGSARSAAQLAQLAEEAGWDGVFLGDAIWTEDPMIALAAAAMVTRRIRLGTMIIPMPLRRPWKVASESVALDRLSGGRLILGLGAGAVWMGWHAFPDEVTDKKARAEMLDESIDILTLLFRRQPFDYDGKHHHIKLTALDVQFYPPEPVQRPRIPLWTPGLWPRQTSLRRAMKCDGVIVEKVNAGGISEEVTPDDVRGVKAFADAHRADDTPFDVVVNGKTTGLDDAQARNRLLALRDAGATWWVEGMWGDTVEQVDEHIRKGPPLLR